MHCRCVVVAVLGLAGLTAAQTCYEGDAWPEGQRWVRQTNDPDNQYPPIERELINGWLVQHVEPWCDPPEMNCGHADSYLGNLLAYEGQPFFAEWRLITDCPDEEVNSHFGGAFMVLVGGSVTFHVNIARGLVQFYREPEIPFQFFKTKAGEPHAYRLEVYPDWYEFFIDGELVAADVPENVFPASDALISFGARYHLSGHTTEWDYVKFGVLTEPGEGKCDANDEVDLKDYRMLERCLRTGGPDSHIWFPNCLFYDYDKDNDIDLRDVAAFQSAFTGSEE